MSVTKTFMSSLPRTFTGEAELEDSIVGKLLNNRFKILELLGTGGMGRVYKAVQVPLDRPVAVKVLDPRYGEGRDPGFRKRFLLEASLTAQLRHPNTITIFDYGRTEDGIYYIAMEYLEGQTLADVLTNEGPMAWARVLDVARQICRSLREAHKMGLVHRDLKPANVMLLNDATDGEVVKVLDFGLVKPFLPDAPGQELEITQAGVLLGSPLYMAPEQSKNESDPRSDIYSLGVLMYQMLSGRPPFIGKQAIDVIMKHIREKPTPLHTLRPEIPHEVSLVVMKCLEKNPDNRFQTMDELLEAIKVAGNSLGIAATVTAPHSVMSQVSMLSGTPAASRAMVASASRSSSKTILWASLSFIVSLAVGLGVAYPLAEKNLRKDAHAPSVTLPSAQPPAAKIAVTVQSDPSGAVVKSAGETIGVTPFSMEVEANAQSMGTLELSFSKDGFIEKEVTATGRGPTLQVFQKLEATRSR